jgi:hypothetical protein
MYFSGANLCQESSIQATAFYSVHLLASRIGKLFKIAFTTIGKYQVLKLCRKKSSMEKIETISSVRVYR